MIWLQWGTFGLLGLVVAALLVLTAGALLSLDWRKCHTRAAAALPRLRDPISQPDGLTLISVGDLRFRARVANLGGSGEGIILLHGFPQTSAAWQPLMEAASARGYRVVAFDQRGYSPGARPRRLKDYIVENLVSDVLGVANAVGFERFHLVGHDWGSAVGWSVVMSCPERVLTWSSLSIAHNRAFGQALRTDADQRRRSRYIHLFRMRWLPELLLSFNRLQIMRSVMYRWMPAQHVDEYLRVYSEPGALTAVFNWYRAMGMHSGPLPEPRVETPVLFIWGNRDPAAGRRAVELQSEYLKGYYRLMELDAGHWLLERRTDTVVDAVLAHIAAGPRGASPDP